MCSAENLTEPMDIQPLLKAPLASDDFRIQSLRISDTGLIINVIYGGSKKHTFQLKADYTNIYESYPPQIDMFLYHDADNDYAKKLFRDELLFDLTSFQDSLKEINPDITSIILRIHKGNEKEVFSTRPEFSFK